jgi:hypothetical protein
MGGTIRALQVSDLTIALHVSAALLRGNCRALPSDLTVH